MHATYLFLFLGIVLFTCSQQALACPEPVMGTGIAVDCDENAAHSQASNDALLDCEQQCEDMNLVLNADDSQCEIWNTLTIDASCCDTGSLTETHIKCACCCDCPPTTSAPAMTPEPTPATPTPTPEPVAPSSDDDCCILDPLTGQACINQGCESLSSTSHCRLIHRINSAGLFYPDCICWEPQGECAASAAGDCYSETCETDHLGFCDYDAESNSCLCNICPDDPAPAAPATDPPAATPTSTPEPVAPSDEDCCELVQENGVEFCKDVTCSLLSPDNKCRMVQKQSASGGFYKDCICVNEHGVCELIAGALLCQDQNCHEDFNGECEFDYSTDRCWCDVCPDTPTPTPEPAAPSDEPCCELVVDSTGQQICRDLHCNDGTVPDKHCEMVKRQTSTGVSYDECICVTPEGQCDFDPAIGQCFDGHCAALGGWCDLDAEGHCWCNVCDMEPTSAPAVVNEPTTRAPTTRSPTTDAPTKAPTTRAPTTRPPTTRPPTDAPPTGTGDCCELSDDGGFCIDKGCFNKPDSHCEMVPGRDQFGNIVPDCMCISNEGHCAGQPGTPCFDETCSQKGGVCEKDALQEQCLCNMCPGDGPTPSPEPCCSFDVDGTCRDHDCHLRGGHCETIQTSTTQEPECICILPDVCHGDASSLACQGENKCKNTYNGERCVWDFLAFTCWCKLC